MAPKKLPKTINAHGPAPVPVPVKNAMSAPMPTVVARPQTRPIEVPNLAPTPRRINK